MLARRPLAMSLQFLLHDLDPRHGRPYLLAEVMDGDAVLIDVGIELSDGLDAQGLNRYIIR
jgi:hypothetical protein